MRIKRYFGWLALIVGGASALISSWSLFEFWIKDQTTLSYIAHGYIILLTILVIIFASVRQYQTIIKEKYANIMPSLHMALHSIRDLETYLIENEPAEDASQEVFKLYLSNARNQIGTVMSHLVTIFSSLTSTNCRACVKLNYPVELNNGTTELHFYAYARDNASAQICREMDRDRVSSNHDSHGTNPIFAEICSSSNKGKWHFMQNNLLKLPSFVSSSLSAYDPRYHTEFRPGSFFERWFNHRWPLPYKSCVACVIRQASTSLMPDRDSTVLGFVSVDSESRGVFQERWDKEIVFAVADTLFRPIMHIISVERKAEAQGYDKLQISGDINGLPVQNGEKSEEK